MNAPPASEAEVVAAFFDRYSAAVLRLCRRLTANEQDAEDARQEAFLQLQRHWTRLDPHSNPVGWLFRTAANAALKIGKKRWTKSDTTENHRPEPALLDAEDRERISVALRALPGEYRALIRERFLEGRTPADIARRLRIPPGRVRVQLCRALRLLREIVRGMP